MPPAWVCGKTPHGFQILWNLPPAPGASRVLFHFASGPSPLPLRLAGAVQFTGGIATWEESAVAEKKMNQKDRRDLIRAVLSEMEKMGIWSLLTFVAGQDAPHILDGVYELLEHIAKNDEKVNSLWSDIKNMWLAGQRRSQLFSLMAKSLVRAMLKALYPQVSDPSRAIAEVEGELAMHMLRRPEHLNLYMDLVVAPTVARYLFLLGREELNAYPVVRGMKRRADLYGYAPLSTGKTAKYVAQLGNYLASLRSEERERQKRGISHEDIEKLRDHVVRKLYPEYLALTSELEALTQEEERLRARLARIRGRETKAKHGPITTQEQSSGVTLSPAEKSLTDTTPLWQVLLSAIIGANPRVKVAVVADRSRWERIRQRLRQVGQELGLEIEDVELIEPDHQRRVKSLRDRKNTLVILDTNSISHRVSEILGDVAYKIPLS